MIGRLLGSVAGHVQAADAVLKSDDTLSVAISPDGETRATSLLSEFSILRVVREGRIGAATGGSGESELSGLIGRAMTAAAAGEELPLFLPAPAPTPRVVTRGARAAAAGVTELEGLARSLLDRLRRGTRRVETWAERSAGSVRVGNTRGVLAGYESTLAGIGAVVESLGVGCAPPCRVQVSGGELPTLQDVEGLVSEVNRRLEPPIVTSPVRNGATLPVCVAPRAVVTLLRPLRARLMGGRATVQAGEESHGFDPRLTVGDDPLAQGRPGSRPIDDEGVVSRRLPLIERGRVVGQLTDLTSGARADLPSTGHAWRTPHAAPRVGFTNLVMLPGTENQATLLTMMGRGILVEDLTWSGGSNPASGTFALRAPWAYLIEGGRVRGRLEGLVLSGNVFRALTRLGGVGNDPTWIGSARVPSLLLESLTISVEE